MELDLEEISGDIPWDPDIDESRAEDPPAATDRSLRNSTKDYSRLSRVLSRPTPSPPPQNSMEDTSLPALPEPSYDSSEEDEKRDTLSSRQASLFRSPSHSLSRGGSTSREKTPRLEEPNASHETTLYRDAKSSLNRSRDTLKARDISRHTTSPNQSRSVRMDVTPLDPIRVNTVHMSTPTRLNTSVAAPTPHPPGKWYSPVKGSKPTRSSPLARKEDQSLMASEGDISIHRLRISPARKSLVSPEPSPMLPKEMEKVTDEDEGNSSFLSRLPGLTRMVAKK